jgi:hypothetical protein
MDYIERGKCYGLHISSEVFKGFLQFLQVIVEDVL